MRTFAYIRPATVQDASSALAPPNARAMGGGTDLLTQQDRGIMTAESVVDLRGLRLSEIGDSGDGLWIGATATLAEIGRHPAVAERFTALSEAIAQAASPQLREMGTLGGNLCQQVRCWYFRHPDLVCWLKGGDTCYAQIGDHRKHGLEPGDCISVAPSDLAAALIALGASVETSRRPEGIPLIDLYRRPTEDNRSNLTLEEGEFVTAVTIPRTPDASAYERGGERHAWSFALAGVAAARSGDEVRLAAIGIANVPRLLDPADPLAGLPGLEQTAWKRRLLTGLVDLALERVTASAG